MYKTLRLEVTGICDLKCIYCHAARLNTKIAKQEELSIEKKITLINEGKKIGCKTIFVLSGKTSLEAVGGWKVKPDFIKNDLKETVSWLLQKEG